METRARDDDHPRVLEKTDEFVKALRATPVVQRFADAQRRFDIDADVQRLLERFQQLAEAFQRAQQEGTAGAAQVRELRDAQARVRAHAIVREFMDARDAVGTFLQETNLAISETLGVDLPVAQGRSLRTSTEALWEPYFGSSLLSSRAASAGSAMK